MVPDTRYDIITPLVGVIEVLLRCVDCAAGERYLHRVHNAYRGSCASYSVPDEKGGVASQKRVVP